MTTETKPLSFRDILKLAVSQIAKLERIVLLLEDSVGMEGDPHYDTAQELVGTLTPIRFVLERLGCTPNAYINREALDSFQVPVDEASDFLASPHIAELLRTGLLSDEVDF